MEKEKVARIMVFLVIAGLVGAYVPLLFAPRASQQVPAAQVAPSDKTASLTSPEATTTSTSKKITETKPQSGGSPAGFGGLEDENKSLNDLEKQLGQ